MTTFTWLQALQITVTVCGFAFAIWQLRREYGWRRRQFPLHILAEWNEKTDPQASRDEAPVALTPERAEAIYRARSGDHDRDLRTHILELLNYGEYGAVSYTKGVADREILAESLCRTITRWYRQLRPYVLTTEKHRGFDPWKPLSRFVAEVETAAEPPSRIRL